MIESPPQLAPGPLIDEYLRILMIPDPAGVAHFVSPALVIRFTGNRAMRQPGDTSAFNAKRYAWVKKKIERTEVVAGGTPEETVVYSLGTLDTQERTVVQREGLLVKPLWKERLAPEVASVQ